MVERDEAAKFTDKPADEPLDRPIPPMEEKKINGGILHSFGLPKPVEVLSVPETPVNGSTPAGGTPRPELNLTEEPAPPTPEALKEPVIEPVVMTGVEEPKPSPVASVPDEKPAAPAEELKPALEQSKPVMEESKPIADPTEPASIEPIAEPIAEAPLSKAPELAVNDSLVNGAMDIDTPEDKPPAPVTHTGPESEPVPAPAPAPPAAPVAAPPPAIPEAPPVTIERSAPVPPVEPERPSAPTDPIVGEKRKLEGDSVLAADAVPASVKPLTEDRAAPVDPLPLDKKPKLDESVVNSVGGEPAKVAAPMPDPISASTSTTTSAPAPAPALEATESSNSASGPVSASTEASKEAPQTSPKAGNSKKEKKLPPVGKTQRKTRSQGPADV